MLLSIWDTKESLAVINREGHTPLEICLNHSLLTDAHARRLLEQMVAACNAAQPQPESRW